MSTTIITTRKTTKQPKIHLKPGTVYSCDNGELRCLKCAGMTATFTGRDRSGRKVVEMTEADNIEWLKLTGRPMACESGCTVYGIAKEITALQLA
jgi:hypothetical protein